MLARIIIENPYVKTDKLFLLKVVEISDTIHIIRSNEYKYENPFPVFGRTNPKSVKVYEYCVNGKVYYKCFGRKFYGFRDAKKYADFMSFKLRFKIKKDHDSKKSDSKELFKLIGKCHYYHRIWRKIWKDCYQYNCFSVDNFFQLRQRYIYEINMYRLKHKLSPIVQHPDVTSIAEHYLQKIMTTRNTDIAIKYLRFFYKIRTNLAPILIKQWHDEIKYYKYNAETTVIGAEHFSLMIWKHTKYAGFAIEEKDGTIYLTYIFTSNPYSLNWPLKTTFEIKRSRFGTV